MVDAYSKCNRGSFNVMTVLPGISSHYKDKMDVRPSYLHNRNPFTDNAASLYWDSLHKFNFFFTCFLRDSVYGSHCIVRQVHVWGLLKLHMLISPWRKICDLQKYKLDFMNCGHICQVSPQLSCGDTWQIWPWYSESDFLMISKNRNIDRMEEIGLVTPTTEDSCQGDGKWHCLRRMP